MFDLAASNPHLDRKYFVLRKAITFDSRYRSPNFAIGMIILQQTFTGHRGPVYALESWDENLLSGSGDGTVVRWRKDRPGEGELMANVGQAVFSLNTIDNERLLLIGTEGGDVFVIDMKAGKEIQH